LSNDLINSSDLYALQLHRLTSLQFLYLGANQIDSGSGQALNQILRDCSELRELDLHNNKLGDLGVIQAFNTTEPIAVSLESLSLTTNLLSDESICNLAANFLATSRITFLRLALNEIGDRGALAMASFLSSPTCRLKTLILHHNRIHTQGAEALVDVMQTGRNTLISELGISHNPISKHELFHLARFYTKLNRHGRYLLLDPNSIPQSLWAHVLARISHEADSRNYFIKQLPELFDTARR
jgi:Ran GTPase-activating protein (RanGAP) involved in mRNA processing and transport